MNGFDYARRSRAFDGGALRALAISLLTIAILAGLWRIEHTRLSGLDDRIAGLRSEVARAQVAARKAQPQAANLALLRGLKGRLDEARRETIASTNAVIRIGNGLPHRTWLTQLEAAPSGIWTVTGTSTSLEEIGQTLARLAHSDGGAGATLRSISSGLHANPSFDFTIALEPGR